MPQLYKPSCRHSCAAFARARRASQEWQHLHPPLSLAELLRGRTREEFSPRGVVDDDAARALAATILRRAVEDADWDWLEDEGAQFYAELAGLDAEVLAERVKHRR